MVNCPQLSDVNQPTVPPFATVFREHSPYVWRALKRLGVRPGDVEDVAQEVFIIVHRKLAEFEGRSSLRTFIYGICVRKASDHRRKAHVRREVASERVPEGMSAANQEQALAAGQARARLDAALDRLDDEKRAVFVLFEIEELPMKEVAEAVGCPAQTAYARLYAARAKLKSFLSQPQATRRVS